MDFSIASLLGVAEGASSWANFLAVVWRVTLVVLGVNMLVIVHEFGHFIVARMCGVRCDKFYIWFDAYGFKFFSFKRGDTEYGLGWLPLGGYVKMFGQEDNPGGIQAEIDRAKAESAEKGGELTEEEQKARGEQIEQLEKQLYAPDSYLSKNVFQRMAIISAGVIMNILFAIVCATCAALMGTPETSAKVGFVSPGSPAWLAGFEAGDEIVAIGENEKPIFSSILVACMDRKELTFKISRPGEKEPKVIKVTPRIEKGALTPMIGVGPSPSLDLADTEDHRPYELSFDEKENEELIERLGALKGGERLLSMNNMPVSSPADYLRWKNLFIDRPIEFVFAPTVEKRGGERVIDDSKEKIVVTVDPKRAPDVGVRLTMGEIVAIQPGSVAEKAGLVAREVAEDGSVVKHGDVLLNVDNEPILNPLWFPYTIFNMTGKETRNIAGANATVKAVDSEETNEEVVSKPENGASSSRTILLTVRRDDKQIDIPITLPKAAPYTGLTVRKDVLACDSLGVAYQVKPIVSGIDGSTSVEKSPLGGAITEIEAKIANPGTDAPKSLRDNFKTLTGQSVKKSRKGELASVIWRHNPKSEESVQDDAGSVSWFSDILPYLPNGAPVTITVERLDGEEAKIETKVKRDGDVFVKDRGFFFGVDAVYQRADNMSEALSFGVSKTIEAASQVFVFLKNVGKNVSAKALGGPGLIVGTAYQAAGRNDGVFLLFLCLISANLAVVNFLPIPVLDGGHMVFLLYEAITGRKPNEKIQIGLSYIGLFLILALMFWVIFLDIVRYCF